MSELLSRLTVSRKLGLLLAGGIAQVVLVGALGLWAVHTIQRGGEQQSVEADKMMKAHRVAGDMQRVNTVVGHVTFGDACASCHGADTGGDLKTQVAIINEYTTLLNQLKQSETTLRGRQLISELETSGNAWRDSNLDVLKLGQAGKKKEAMDLYREGSTALFWPVDKALKDYIAYQEPRLAEVNASNRALLERAPVVLLVLVVLATVVGLLIGRVVALSVSRPLAAAVEHIGIVASGNVSREMEPGLVDRKDEIGDICRAIQTMEFNLREMIGDLQMGIGILQCSSDELNTIAGSLSGGARGTSERAHAVAAAAEEMSVTTTSVAAGMEQAAHNLATVTYGTGQMTATIKELGGNAARARTIVHEVAETADVVKASASLARLSEVVSCIAAGLEEQAVVTNDIAHNISEATSGVQDANSRVAQASLVSREIASQVAGVDSASGQIAEGAEQVRSSVDSLKRLAGRLQEAVARFVA